MDGPLHQTLALWSNFYIVTGSAAAALTGLQFVVQTLISSEALLPAVGKDMEGGIAAFGSPTVVHFSVALVLSSALCVPWHGYGALRLTLGLLGVGALIYAAIVLGRTLRQKTYEPALEDWIFHVILPATSYAAILLSAVRLAPYDDTPLFVIAAATLLLICVGIHNAWDTVTYLSITAVQRQRGQQSPTAPAHGRGKGGGRKR